MSDQFPPEVHAILKRQPDTWSNDERNYLWTFMAKGDRAKMQAIHDDYMKEPKDG